MFVLMLEMCCFKCYDRKRIIKGKEKEMKEKKYIKSTLVTVLYVIAIIAAAYAIFMLVSTVVAIVDYGKQAGQAVPFKEIFTALLQAVFQPLVSAVLVFVGAKIYDAVRILNPKNYATDEELLAAKKVKEEAKIAKMQAKQKEKDNFSDDVKVVETSNTKDVKLEVKKPATKKSVAKKTTTKKSTTTKKPATKKSTKAKK
ncbi:MAG: hypothetical protein Q4E61_02965 [Alphaproteobacteria bacterium]|nr:hypothetical protein [Alphaproteobacteria bacterium]